MSIRITIYLITMTLILCIMTLGYAALQERVDVEVEASIDSTYRVEITRVQEGTVNGDARSTRAPSYHDLTSTFNVGLTNDTDYITYTIEITNYSTVDIRLNNTEINTTNNNMKVTKSGIRNGDIMLAGSTKTATVRVKLGTETEVEQNGTITINFDFTRLKGGLGEAAPNLPSYYKECEYIESTGTQYIDTKVFPTNLTLINIDFKINADFNRNNNVIGSRERGTSNKFGIITNRYQKIGYFYGSQENENVADLDNNRHQVTLGKNTFKVDNNAEVVLNYEEFSVEYSIYIYGFHNNYNSQYNSYKLYGCLIIEGDEVVRDFIPTLDDNGVPCLYDTVSGETFYNQGTGDFLYQLK